MTRQGCPDLTRIRNAVRRYAERNGIPPTITEIASNVGMTNTRVFELSEEIDSGLSVTWTGPKPRGISGMLLELDDETV